MPGLVLQGELAGRGLDVTCPAGECGRRFVADPGYLDRLAVGTAGHPVADLLGILVTDLLELLVQEPVAQRAEADLEPEQRVTVKRPPFPVRSVRSLHPVGDRVVHVQLRVAVPVGVLRERGHDQAGAVPVLPRRRRMVAGADVSGLPLRHGDHPVTGPLNRSADLTGPLGEPLRLRFVARGFRFG